jgi:hypothetical protein
MTKTKKTTRKTSYHIMGRSLGRCGETAGESGMAPEITRVYNDALAPAAEAFCKAHEAVVVAKSTAKEKRIEIDRQLAVFDPIYRGARSAVVAFAPAKVLPDTLKAQSTDTDVLMAIAALRSVVQSHAGQTWADELMAGRFGTLAAKIETALKESIDAGKALAGARLARMEAYGPAYQQYVAFKHVVRDILGASSVQYRRLHPRRAVPAYADPDEEAAPDSGVMPANEGAPALANGPLSGKVA